MSGFKMTDEQKALFDDLTRLQQEVCLNSISGMNDIDSYKNSSGKAKNENTMAANVSAILRNPKVVKFMNAMKEVVVSDAVMSRQEVLEELSIISRTNSDDLIEWGYRDVETVNEEGEKVIVKQSYWTLRDIEDIDPKHRRAIEEVSIGKDGLKFKRTSKLAAMKQLAEMQGYNAAQKFDHSSLDGSMSPKAAIEINENMDPKEAANLYREMMKE